MINFSAISNKSFIGKVLRFPVRFIPKGAVVPILQGRLKGKKWIVGAGDNHGYWLGSYEYEMQSLILKIVKQGSVVYDIGANAGFYTLLFSEIVGMNGEVFAFEPLPENILYLKKHLRLNFCNNVKVIETAVSESCGREFFEPGINSALGILSSNGSINVKVVSLDEFLLRDEIKPPNYIKIDVEGSEFRVLSGAKTILSKYFPVIFLATHGIEMHKKCRAFLKEIGYNIQSIYKNQSIEECRSIIAFKEAPNNKILAINKKENDKINVALVCTSMNQLGGKNAHLRNIYTHIDKDRFNICIVGCSKVENELKNFMLLEKVKKEDLILVPRVKKWLLIPFILQLRKVFLSKKIDIVHTFQIQSDILGGLAARLAGIKCLISQYESKIIEDNISAAKQFFYKIANKMIKDWFKKTVVVSHGLKRELISGDFRASDSIVVIPIGFEIFDKHRNVKFSTNNLKERKPTIGTVSRLSKEKGIDRFIAAMPFILEIEPNVEFVIASEGPLKEELKKQVETLGLMSKVNFIGWIEDILSFVNSIDIFVMPSIREGYPIALLEALALKKPVVASRIDGIIDIIDDGKNGLLVDTANPQEFSKAILSLCVNPEKAMLMGENGYNKVTSEFTIIQEMFRFRDLYNQVLKKE